MLDGRTTLRVREMYDLSATNPQSPYINLLNLLNKSSPKIIVVAILVNFLRIFKVRKINPFRGHDRAVAKNRAS